MKILTIRPHDDHFPPLLRLIHSVPKQLYYLGQPPIDTTPAIAIVGSRRPTGYGLAVTKLLSEELARRGVTIVSGLALGIDAVAHRAALKAGGRTIAIMPGGLERVYPASHQSLAKDILLNGGTLISEYASGTPPFKQNFVARNRLVSGMSDAVLVTEAAAKSGTLITVKFALEQGKTVLSVPGNITSVLSAGTNNLIKTGATPVTDVVDILHAIGLEDTEKQHTPVAMSADEGVIIQLLSSGITQQEELLSKCNLPVTAFNSTLTMLEITGRVENIGQGQWILR